MEKHLAALKMRKTKTIVTQDRPAKIPLKKKNNRKNRVTQIEI